MAERLTNLYPKGCRVEIQWLDQWWDGVVIAHAHPAVWVQIERGERLFVTNRSRIRKQKDNEA